MPDRPLFLILAGPNGAGKSTAAASFLPEDVVFLNADEMAKSLPGYPSTSADFQAGERLLRAMTDCEKSRVDFAVETTLASKSLASRARRLQSLGYLFRLIFLWTPAAEFSINRVADRVRCGGHSVPEETVRRRYAAGLRNLFEIYIPIADSWSIYDNTSLGGYRLIAQRLVGECTDIRDGTLWELVQKKAKYGTEDIEA